jgi:hypothetical protein
LKLTQKNRPRGAASKPTKTKIKTIISEKAFYASAFAALKAEAVENGSTRLSIFYTDGKATGYTTGRSNRRRAAGGRRK